MKAYIWKHDTSRHWQLNNQIGCAGLQKMKFIQNFQPTKEGNKKWIEHQEKNNFWHNDHVKFWHVNGETRYKKYITGYTVLHESVA